MTEPVSGEARPLLSVVVLAYNERENLEPVVEEALAVLGAQVPDLELILVDDGSSDGTGPLADALAQRSPGTVRVLHHEHNRGMGAGLRSGFGAAAGRWLSFLPADGQIDPADLLRLLAQAGEAKVVLNYYERRDDGLRRKVLSRGLRVLTWALTGSRWRNEGPYLIENGLQDRFAPQSDTFFYNLEIIIRCERAGIPMAAIYSRTRQRRSGQSKVTSGRRILRVAQELWRVGRRG